MLISESDKLKIGFVGLGRMGGGIAQNIVKAGYETMVYDVDSSKYAPFYDKCRIGGSVGETFDFSDVLLISLPGSPQVEAVVEPLLECNMEGRTIIDLSTSYPMSSIRLYQAIKQNNGVFMDASLTGSPENAIQGTLNVLVGGEEEQFRKYSNLLASFSKNRFYTGSAGTGNLMKLASNYLSIMYIALYAEILPFVEQLGVNPAVVFDVISASGANSPIFQLVAPKIIKERYDISFLMDLGFKDLSYLKRLMDEKGLPSFLMDSGINLYKMAKCKGLGQNDISEVAKVIRDIIKDKSRQMQKDIQRIKNEEGGI